MGKKKYTIVGLFSSFSQIRWNEVRPFKQLPSDNQFPKAKPNPAEMEIDELFSRFTADIIKKNTRYTR